jgi:hypothetical protein
MTSAASASAPPTASAPAPSPEYDEYGTIVPWPPTVVSAPAIPLPPISSAPFVVAGCKELGRGEGLDCAKARGYGADACRFGVRREPALGALGAIYECWSVDDPPALGMFRAGGLAGAVLVFLVVEKSAVVVVRDRSEFVRRFAPVDTPEKALGFAVAFTNGRPAFDPVVPPQEDRVYVNRIDGTRVVAAADGWNVNLFSSAVFGCGIHPALSLEVHVARGGDVTVTRHAALYADPRHRTCVD